MYFYELHEGDGDVFADLMLAREEEMEAEEFFSTVNAIRERIVDSHHHDTLIEAIAEELERDYDFIYVSDAGSPLRSTCRATPRELPNRSRTAGRGGSRGRWRRRGIPLHPRRIPVPRATPQLTVGAAAVPRGRPTAAGRLAAEEDLDDVAVPHPVSLAFRA